MNAKQTLITSLVALAATALVGCGGSAPHAKSGGYDYTGDAAQPAAEAPQDFGADADEAEGEGDGFSAGQSAPMPAQPGAPPPTTTSKSADRSARNEEARPGTDDDPFELSRKPKNRPGLATQWGEQRFSRVTTAPFVRADRLSPFAVGKLFYNDPEGIAAMSDTRGSVRNHMRRFAVGSGFVEMGLRDGSGRMMTGFESGGDSFVTGIKNRRYTIVVKNHSPGRIEAVVSVDGLDVIDGKPASFSKRGYLLDPFGDLEIEGFRTSTTEVASFRFGAVNKSYAAKKHGNTRNVGVIGMAVFHERGDSPRFWGTPRSHQDTRARSTADPFPQQFASPPN